MMRSHHRPMRLHSPRPRKRGECSVSNHLSVRQVFVVSVTKACNLAIVLLIAAICCDVEKGFGAGVPLHDGLISYWPLSENFGAIAHDYAPGGSVVDNGQVRNAPTWIDGMFGAGLQFNGTNQDVLIPNSADMNVGTAAVTLSAWVKLD